MPPAADRALVAGIYLAAERHNAAALADEFARASRWRVDQRWIALGEGDVPDSLKAVTIRRAPAPASKFALLNGLLQEAPLDEYAYIVVSDDDIALSPGFLDEYLALVCRHDFALAQPARTADSFIDHPFVARLPGIDARWTRFVEIGPLFTMRRDAVRVLVPFDGGSPMGWGFDFTWPCLLEAQGFKLGIVDATPVEHKLRRPVALYDHGDAHHAMESFLRRRPHLARDDAFVIIEPYV
jgi:hypothetical protein